ncbi:hypothetical protein Esi_0033_0105 [Ectocarpus siliculosus]|uniref:Uncharacterized protein n=1 Tax=Ectocarpus siliculosus TaxID=2880 RepID=D7FXL9_ECTSI|nr:hypothetical protein Esi_0033_0105 [Ectocarpus siliculosus]|eukprot:CBJ26460.1 hypothetical protein Esi_0033_0105 [Ectocarpus siliculosus]
MVVPIPGPLPSAERSEEIVRLPASVIPVLKGQAKSKSGNGLVVARWLILKDIQKHTGTTATAISVPRAGADEGRAGTGKANASATKMTEDAAESTAEATPTAVADGDADEDLVLLVKGPTNCVEVAAEALRKLGRKETVRDALTFVKTTSPHRRLTQQRRQEQQQQQQQQEMKLITGVVD